MEVYVEGNIGTGKTTFLNHLDKIYPENEVIYEPVEEWTQLKDTEGKNILENFYENQNKWSFAFQMNSFISRIKKIKDCDKSKIKFIERSIYTDKYCFADNCYKNGKMNKIEYDIYNNWHEWLSQKFDMKPTAFIYLKTIPEISLGRIQKRNRSGENDIPLDYLKQLDNLHDIWMEREISNNVPVLILDVSKNFYNDEIETDMIKNSIDNFLEHLVNKKSKKK